MAFAHSAAFRQHAVELARQDGNSIPQLALDLGVSPTTIRKWLVNEDRRSGDGQRRDRKELDELRREVRCLSVEVELLKRVALHYADPTGPARVQSRAR